MLLKILSSIRLAIIVISLIIAGCIPATMIMQNQDSSFYLDNFSPGTAWLIMFTGMDRFFISPIFLFLVIIFFINLLTCSLKRFYRQLKKRQNRKFGPDIIHLGLLVLIIGSVISLYTRQEGVIFMQAGDSMLLPSGRYLNMENFVFERYDDGRPKDWISRLNISSTPDSRGSIFELQVNNPLRIDDLVIYQSGYRPASKPGTYATGLLLTQDRGKAMILTSFIFISAGLCLTIFQKRKEI